MSHVMVSDTFDDVNNEKYSFHLSTVKIDERKKNQRFLC